MTYSVDLAIRAEDALAQLPDDGRSDVMETIAAALVRRETWPAPGGWDGAAHFGRRSWIAFTAHAVGIEVYDVWWVG
ncbi:hypothetical protein [Streptomyces alanosinicus]|nr:hypothetical protein [Streptomyces alanosinicus]